MTVTPTELATIFARLERLETRQNLLKDNLLSLKKKVDSLATAFRERPELPQIQQIQASIDQLAKFGDRLEEPILSSPLSSESKPTEVNIDGIDPDMLVMPILEGDSALEMALDTDLEADLSTLLDTIDDGEGGVLGALTEESLAMGNNIEDLTSDSGELGNADIDSLDIGDRPPVLDLDNLDLANISLDDLAKLDISALSGLETPSLDHGLPTDNLSPTDELPLDDGTLTLDDLALNDLTLGDVSLTDDRSDALAFEGELEDLGGLETASILPPLNPPLSDRPKDNNEQTLPPDELPFETFDLDPLAMNAIDLEDLSQSEMASLLDTGFGQLSLDEPDLLDGDLALNLDETSSQSIASTSPAEISELDAELGELDLDLDELELEIAAEMSDYDGITDFEIPIDPTIPDIAANLLDPPSLKSPTLKQNPETSVDTPDITPIGPAPDAPTLSENLPPEDSLGAAVIESELVDIDTDIDIDTEIKREEPKTDPKIAQETEQAIAPPSSPEPASESPQPVIETKESAQELELESKPEPTEVIATQPEQAIAIEAELTAAEIVNRINNRQHYFIGFQLPQIQLSQQNLRDCVFDKTNLQNCQLQNSDLRDTSFKESNLNHANLAGTSLERANFEKADLRNANFQDILFNARTNFRGANLEGANFSGLDLTRSPDFKHANLSQTNFNQVNLRGVNCKDWYLAGASFRHANLIDTNLKQTTLTDADLTGAIYSLKTTFPRGFQPQGARLITAGADLSEQDLSGYDLSELDLTKINLSKANLTQTNFTRCDLTDADLSGANLRRSQLRATCLEANFTAANLTAANLTEANVTGSNFTEANFEQAILKEANFTMTDLRGANFQEADTYRLNCNGANLEGMDLTGLNFEGDLSGANLSHTKLCGLNFNYLDLSWANLTKADVTNATFKETNLENANLRDAQGFDLENYDYKIHLSNIILPDGQTLD